MNRLDFVGQMPMLDVRAKVLDDGTVELRSGAVGVWCDPPAVGSMLLAGDGLGEIEILGRRTRLLVPAGVGGVVMDYGADDGRRAFARRPVDFDRLLLRLDPKAAAADAGSTGAAATAEIAGGGLVFRAHSSGRFYSRARPDTPPFVEVGATIKTGDTVGLLEVMKTFTRLVYQGDGLPTTAVVRRIVPVDDTDLEPGDPILELDAANG